MMTLYTSVGVLKLHKSDDKSYPTVSNSGREHVLDQLEMLIWSSMAFQFLNLLETRQIFEQQLQTYQITPGYSFEHYIRRLLFRGLIVKGDGLTSTDALYELLGNLYIVPLTNSFPVRLFSVLHLLLKGQVTPVQIKQQLKGEVIESPVEKLILNLTREKALSTAELLYGLDTEKIVNIRPAASGLTGDGLTCEERKSHAHTQYLQPSVLMAIGNLYLQKRILFKTL